MGTPLQRLIVAVCLSVGVAAVALGATTVSTTVRLDGLPSVVVTGAGTSVSLQGKGRDSEIKQALVQRWSVNGQEVDVLIRIERARGELWIDLVADASITSLSTRMASLDMTGVVHGHPSPKKDKIDKAALVEAGGS